MLNSEGSITNCRRQHNRVENRGVKMWRVLLIFCAVFPRLESAGPPNPCPEIFAYDFDGVKWFGYLVIPSISNAKNIKINVRLSVATALPSKFAGKLRLLNPKESIFNTVRENGFLSYKVYFPVQLPLPVLTEISVNGNRLCAGPPVTGSFVTDISLEHTLVLQPQALSNNCINCGSGIFKLTPKRGHEQPAIPPSAPANNPLPLPPPLPQQGNTGLNPFPSKDFRPSPTDEPSIVGFKQSVSGGNPDALPVDDECGRATVTKPLIVNGSPSLRAAYPWLVAIFVHMEDNLGIVFKCGGNLISQKHILSAAHCITLSGRSDPEGFLAVLGKYEIKKFTEPGSLIADVRKLDIHPDYVTGQPDADLAIFTLVRVVRYTSFIRPICLFPEPQELRDLVGKTGTIAGWGRDENGNKVSSEIRETLVRVVSQVACIRSRQEFKHIISNRTFCAGGTTEGAGPCTGDSGGGLLVSRNNRFFLRGIVSTSLAEPGSTASNVGCATYLYSVFVDVTKFNSWIRSLMRST